ncbi:MAG TPA: rhodanese-like domain-containing protein [Actinomycetota bacterium]|nr:rhodanese-like domain-containing protein [Actinomycetota bacterium]
MPSFSEMVEAARPNVREVSAAEAKEMVEADPDALVLDVREPHEWDTGHIPGAVLVPLGQLDLLADPSGPRPNPDLTERTAKLIVTHCATGKRSILAADLLQKLGYRKVVSMKAGFVGWAREGYPID